MGTMIPNQKEGKRGEDEPFLIKSELLIVQRLNSQTCTAIHTLNPELYLKLETY